MHKSYHTTVYIMFGGWAGGARQPGRGDRRRAQPRGCACGRGAGSELPARGGAACPGRACCPAATPQSRRCTLRCAALCCLQVVRQRNLLTSFLQDNQDNPEAARRAYAQSVGRSPLAKSPGGTAGTPAKVGLRATLRCAVPLPCHAVSLAGRHSSIQQGPMQLR